MFSLNCYPDLFFVSSDLDAVERGIRAEVLLVHLLGVLEEGAIEVSFISPLQLLLVRLGLAWVHAGHVTTESLACAKLLITRLTNELFRVQSHCRFVLNLASDWP